MSILVLGYFGFVNNQLDGQTIKTRNIFSLLKSKELELATSVDFFDTQTFQRSKFGLFKMFGSIRNATILYYLPAHSNLKYLFPLIYIWSKIFKVEIHYVVVGGWLSDYLREKPVHRYMLSRIAGIYPQTLELVNSLRKLQRFSNVFHLHNYRIVKPVESSKAIDSRIRIVFMARVHPMKGIHTVFDLGAKLESNSGVEIDVYGPILAGFETEFDEMLHRSKKVKYQGILEPSEINNILKDYDFMIFPTQYYTEGFPGSILDAYLSGIPVVASEWQYGKEFVNDGESGLLVKFGDNNLFIEKVLHLVNTPALLESLKTGALKEGNKYSPEKAWDILKANMYKKD